MIKNKAFSSTEELIAFARPFLSNHLRRFRKDIKICLTSNADGKHAYFPCLITCISFLEFLSGLYVGSLEKSDYGSIKKFVEKFLPEYNCPELDILYKCFRHKVAHLAHPYDVFVFDDGVQKMRIAWTLNESRKSPAISIRKRLTPTPLRRAPKNWGVVYDHVFYVHLGRLADDLAAAVFEHSGYFHALGRKSELQVNFQKCMNDYFET